MSRQTDHSHRIQTGSILIMVIVVLSGIGAVTAGLLTILQQRTITAVEEIRMLRGFGVADSYRLALIDGRDLGNEDLLDNGFVDSASNTYTGAIKLGENLWGYKFRYSQNGVSGGNDIPAEKPDGYIYGINLEGNNASNLCDSDRVCRFNAGNGKKPDPKEKVYFQEDTELDFNPNTDITFEGLIVDGDLTLTTRGNGNASLCVTGTFGVKGTVSGEVSLINSNCISKPNSNELLRSWSFR